MYFDFHTKGPFIWLLEYNDAMNKHLLKKKVEKKSHPIKEQLFLGLQQYSCTRHREEADKRKGWLYCFPVFI